MASNHRLLCGFKEQKLYHLQKIYNKQYLVCNIHLYEAGNTAVAELEFSTDF